MENIRKPVYVFMTGFAFTIVNMALFGIYEVVSQGKDIVNQAALEGISGIGHIVLAVGIVWMVVKLFQNESVKGVENIE